LLPRLLIANHVVHGDIVVPGAAAEQLVAELHQVLHPGAIIHHARRRRGQGLHENIAVVVEMQRVNDDVEEPGAEHEVLLVWRQMQQLLLVVLHYGFGITVVVGCCYLQK
jgi:hypothetical protein